MIELAATQESRIFPDAWAGGMDPCPSLVSAILEGRDRALAGTPRDRLAWLHRLLGYVRGEGDPAPQTLRFGEVLGELRQTPGGCLEFGALLLALMTEIPLTALFAEAGLPRSTRLTVELLSRVGRRLSPWPPGAEEGSEWLAWTFGSPQDARIFSGMPAGAMEEILDWMDAAWAMDGAALPGVPGVDNAIQSSMREALKTLASEITALGLDEELRARAPQRPLSESPCFRLPFEIDLLLKLLVLAPRGEPEVINQADRCEREIRASRNMIGSVTQCLHDYGSSPGLVYRLDRLGLILARIESLVQALERSHRLSPRQGSERAASVETWLEVLLGGLGDERRALPLAKRCLAPVFSKGVDRTAKFGEKCIARTLGEYLALLRSCGGGGLITGATVVLKYLIIFLKSPLLLGGFLTSINYSLSFLVMHVLSFKLATKQSAALGVALATGIKSDFSLREVARESASVVRSMVGSVVANVALVIPACLGFHWVFAAVKGHAFMDAAAAHHLIQSLHPLRTLTLPYAILTGALLWLSSALAGWMENWALYRKIPALLQAKGGRPGKLISGLVSGATASISLGFLLGLVPVLGTFFNLPLDVRHVTLSSGSLAMAVATLGGAEAWTSGVASAAAGILLIGAANFFISFVIGFATAMRARCLDRGVIIRIFAALRAEGGQVAWQFLLPPRGERGVA